MYGPARSMPTASSPGASARAPEGGELKKQATKSTTHPEEIVRIVARCVLRAYRDIPGPARAQPLSAILQRVSAQQGITLAPSPSTPFNSRRSSVPETAGGGIDSLEQASLEKKGKFSFFGFLFGFLRVRSPAGVLPLAFDMMRVREDEDDVLRIGGGGGGWWRGGGRRTRVVGMRGRQQQQQQSASARFDGCRRISTPDISLATVADVMQ